jgi:hypothetical protein
MRKSVRRLAAVIGVALTPLATVALANPAVSSAQPLDCGNGWWDPVANVCQPPAVPPPPMCDNGWWWEPVANVCRPPMIPPPA